MLRGSSRLFSVAVVVVALGCNSSTTPTGPAGPSTGQPGSSTTGVLTALDLSAASVEGGQTVNGTVTVTPPVPAAAMTITLAITGSAASAPASVNVPPGQTTATFAVSTTTVETDADVTVSARHGDVERTRTLRVRGTASGGGPLAEMSASHDDLVGGRDTSLTLTLADPAPAGGIAIRLESDTPEVSVPSRIAVPAGAMSASAKVQTSPVTVVKKARVTATVAAGVRARNGLEAAIGAKQIDVVITLYPPQDGDDGEPAGDEAPTLVSLTPMAAARGTTAGVTLTGTNFVDGASIGVSGSGVTIDNVIVVDEETITADFVVDDDATTGARSVTVTTSVGTSGAQTFTVDLAAPTLTSISPANAAQGETVAVTLTGTNFVSGASIGVSGSGATVSNVVIVDEETLTADFVLGDDAATGARSVTVTTSAGTSGAQTFTVDLAAPTLTSISPASAAQGSTVAVTLTGTHFVDGASIDVSGSGVTVEDIGVVDATTITADFAISGLAATGARDVTVTTSAGTTGAQTLSVVLPPAPTLDAVPVMPATSLDGPIIGVTITGTNFVAGATDVSVTDGITVDNIVVTSPATITADFGNLTNSSGTTFDITVTTSGGSDTERVTRGAFITGDRSFEGFENAKCIRVTLAYEDTPGSETEMFLSDLPPRGLLYHFDENQLNDVGALFEIDDVFTSSPGTLCFVPEPHDHSIPPEAVYTSFTYKTRSRTVVGTIERTETVDIYVTPWFLPPGLRGGRGGGE